MLKKTNIACRFLLFLLALFLGNTSSIVAQNGSLTSMPPAGSIPDSLKSALLQPINTIDSAKNSPYQYFTLQQCVAYALQHQPLLNEALLNTDITKANNAIATSGWLPQVNVSGSLTHYNQLSTYSTARTANSFVPGLAVTQAIFSPSLLYAYRSSPIYLQQAKLVTDSTKIFLVSQVSKLFYNVLLNLEQINVLKEDTARLAKNLRDAYHQYVGGIVDETDYEEAQITLNNSVAQLNQATQNILPQYAGLKRIMGLPPEKQFNVKFDTLQLMQAIHIDTNQKLQFENRIEFQQSKIAKQLQQEQVKYYQHSYIPTLSAFYNYNLAYQNNIFPQLFSTSYPSSYFGLTLNFPVFTGLSRIKNLQKARLEEQVIDYKITDLKSVLNTDYTNALANYKSNLFSLKLLQKNVDLAKRTYFVVTLQYKQGVVPYLNVITAESNLINAQINYLNTLFQVLSSKIDLQRAMGSITY